MPENELPTQAVTRRSPLLTAIHGTRRMKSYLVFEGELRTISLLNTGATVFFSAGSFCASQAMQGTEASVKTFAIAAAILFVLGAVTALGRRTEVNQIKREYGEGVPPIWRALGEWLGFLEIPRAERESNP